MPMRPSYRLVPELPLGPTEGTDVYDKLRGAARRLANSEGATAVEYGIMVALIAVVIVTAVILVGTQLGSDFSCVAETMEGAPVKGPSC